MAEKKKQAEKKAEAAPEQKAPQETKQEPKEALVAGKWIKVTSEQLAKIQEEGKLIGYRPDTSEALIK